LSYGEKTKNITVFKRIGFMLEKFSPADVESINQCLGKVTEGATLFAPREKCESFSNKWRMWIPKSMIES
jgi:hypothetical protein